jgi:quinol monooxygenase YgiN
MRLQQSGLLLLMFFVWAGSLAQGPESEKNISAPGEMMVRMAEIEIVPEYLDTYLDILREESETSVSLEPGVICIYPMFQKEHLTQIRLLEIYADREAYESHLQTPHFKHYKETTLKMVKSLTLVDMGAVDAQSMSMIFRKITN